MSFARFYWLVLRRVFSHSFGLAERIEFGLTLLGGIVRWYRLVEGPILELTWTVPLAALVLTWAYRLLQAPYQIYTELVAERDTLRSASMTGAERKQLCDSLGAYAVQGQELIEEFGNYGTINDLEMFKRAFRWAGEVEGYLQERLGYAYRARFAHGAHMSNRSGLGFLMQDRSLATPIQQRCSNLLEIIKEFS